MIVTSLRGQTATLRPLLSCPSCGWVPHTVPEVGEPVCDVCAGKGKRPDGA